MTKPEAEHTGTVPASAVVDINAWRGRQDANSRDFIFSVCYHVSHTADDADATWPSHPPHVLRIPTAYQSRRRQSPWPILISMRLYK